MTANTITGAEKLPQIMRIERVSFPVAHHIVATARPVLTAKRLSKLEALCQHDLLCC
jgi:hypothetical protein